jgi:hypothetical protein
MNSATKVSNGSVTIESKDGSRAEGRWSGSEAGVFSEYSTYDPNGKRTGLGATSSITQENADGGRTTTSVNYSEQSKPDGTTQHTTYQSEITYNATGSVVKDVRTTATVTTNPDGSSTQSRVQVTVAENSNGGTTQTVTVDVVEKNKAGKVTSSVTTSTTVETNSAGNTTTTVKTECTGAAAQSGCGSDYVDPEAETTAIAVTPEQMKTIETKKKFNTTPGPTGSEPVEFDWPKVNPWSISPIALFDETGNVSSMLFSPDYWNSAKGTENFGENGTTIIDADLPHPSDAGTTFAIMMNDLAVP